MPSRTSRIVFAAFALVLALAASCDDEVARSAPDSAIVVDASGDTSLDDRGLQFPDLREDSEPLDTSAEPADLVGDGPADLIEDEGRDQVLDTDEDEGDGSPDVPEDADVDADTCAAWRLVTVPASGIGFADPAPANTGRTIRVRMSMTLSGCAERALPEVTIHEDSRQVDIRLRAWVPQGVVCLPQPRSDERWIQLRLPRAGDWTVRDDAAGGSASLTISVGEAPRDCGDPHTGSCEMDCDCDWREACLGVIGGGGEPTTGCGKPCEVDMDCDGSCVTAPGGISHTCQDGIPHCSDELECPPDYTCTDDLCRATFSLRSAVRVPCTCDADCEAALSCVVAEDVDGIRRCERRCGTASALSCGGGHFCASAAQDISGMAQVDSVCGWVGE